MNDISLLQWLGIAGGLLCFLAIGFRLQRSVNDALNLWILLPTGLALLLIGLFPGLATIPAEVLNLASIKGGRLLALTIAALVAIWLFVVVLSRRIETLNGTIRELQVALAADEFIAKNPDPVSPGTVLVVVPALNEADNLPHVLPRIPSKIASHDVMTLVVNDGSTDGTGEVAAANGAFVASHPIPYGGGAAVRTGYRIASLIGAEFLVTLDADGQHRPEEIEQVVMPLLEGTADMVIGSRVLGQGEIYSVVRLAGVYLFSFFVRILMNSRISDCASGFRSFRVESLRRLRLTAVQYHTAESIIASLKSGLRVTEVPITVMRRMSGESKKGYNLFYAVSFLRSILGAWWR